MKLSSGRSDRRLVRRVFYHSISGISVSLKSPPGPRRRRLLPYGIKVFTRLLADTITPYCALEASNSARMVDFNGPRMEAAQFDPTGSVR